MQPVCGEVSCVVEYHRLNRDKQLNALKKSELNELKEKQKDVPYFKKKLQEKVQAIARHLDHGRGCISCGKPPIGMVYGGHRWAKGEFTSIRFDLHNINSQCFSCNDRKSGNIDGYLKGLAERYGVEYRDYVQNLPSMYHETKLNLYEIKLAYAKAVKIEGELKRNLKLLQPHEIIEKKNEINSMLGYHIQEFQTINKK